MPTPPAPDALTRHGQTDLVVGIDIETHDWETAGAPTIGIGQFGFYSVCRPADLEVRIVQIGWAIRERTGSMHVKERIIKPNDFSVSRKAGDYHGISHERALTCGIPLRHALDEFMEDISDVYKRGGKLVVHNLEFDCGIIDREMQRSGMTCIDEWRRIATGGVCTMDPHIGRWVCECVGKDTSTKSTTRLRLRGLMTILAPSRADLREKAHTAGADAQMHVVVYIELMRLGGIAHDTTG